MADHRVSSRDGKPDSARALNAAARERLETALADLFLPRALRLSEWQRSTMASLLEALVGSIEDDLRIALARGFDEARHPALHAALTSGNVAIALPQLAASGALRDLALVSVLLLRVQEHRMRRARETGDDGAPDLVQALVRDEDTALARSAMALLIARSRRFDRFQQPALASTELSAELEHRLVWTCAAALRLYLVERHDIDPGRADEAISSAVAGRLGKHDEGEGLEARALQLAVRLDELGRLDGAFAARAASEGDLALLLASLAILCQIAFDSVWEIVCDPRHGGAPILLRAAGFSRGDAAAVLLALTDMAGGDEEDRTERQLGIFEAIDDRQARDTIQLWRADPVYRSVLAQLSFKPSGALQP